MGHRGSPGRWPVGKHLLMADVLLLLLWEFRRDGTVEAATRETLGTHLKVHPSRVSRLAPVLVGRGLAEWRKSQPNSFGRPIRVLSPTEEGLAAAEKLREQVLSLRCECRGSLMNVRRAMDQLREPDITRALPHLRWLAAPAYSRRSK